MKLTIAKSHLTNVALQAISAGFEIDGKRAYPLRAARAKLAVARNLARLREILEPAQACLESDRKRILAENAASNPDSPTLRPDLAAVLDDLIREVNAEEVEVNLEPVQVEDLDMDAIQGAQAIEALSILGPILE